MLQVPTSAASDLKRSGPRSTIDLLDIFWRRRRYVIGFTLIGVVLGTLYCLLAAPIYESRADVLVVQKRPQAVTGESQYQSGFEDYLSTHLAIIKSPLIVERAIDSANLASLECFADVEDPDEDLVDTIIGDLEVEGGSRELGESADSIMTLSFRSTVPDDCPIVVQALLDSYHAFHAEVYSGMSDSAMDLIQQARELLRIDLAQQEESYSEFRQSSPLVTRGNDEINPLQDRLTSIEQQRSDVLLRRAQIQQQSLALQHAMEDGSNHEQLLEMVSELRQSATTENNLPTLSTAVENQLVQLLDDEQRLLDRYGPNHPQVATIRQRIASTRRLFALPSTAHMLEPESGNAGEAGTAGEDSVAVYSQYLEQELKRLEISEKLLTDLYDSQCEAAKAHSIFQLKDESYQRNIERTEALYDVIINRLQEASLVKDFGGFEARVIAPPRLGTRVAPSRKIFLPAAAIAGMCLGCLLALVVDLRDDNFHSCEQIQQQLGFPVVGQIPRFVAAPRFVRRAVPSQVALDPMLCSYYQPRSSPAESFRALRTSLFFNGLEKSSRIIQVTGPGVQDGASTIAANLAISLAQTGKRVLLIDADLRQPRQHELFGIPRPGAGLAAIIASDAEPGDAIVQTDVNNLWLLPTGPPIGGPCELFTSPRFAELINLFRDSYDCVLIDTEPLSESADACVIASQSDGVLLALQLNQNSRRRARRAKEMLDRLDVTILGIVVSRMSRAVVRRDHVRRQEYVERKQHEVTPPSRTQPSVPLGPLANPTHSPLG